MLHTVLPEAKTVGVLYCTAEANSELQAAMAKEACESLGLTAQNYTASSSNEIQSVVESMVGKVDAIYVPTDNTMAASAALISWLFMVARVYRGIYASSTST
jgi:putative ABC transport system substrate-binding protein